MHCVSKNDFFGSITIFKNKKSLFLRFTAVWIIHLVDPSPVPFLTRHGAIKKIQHCSALSTPTY